MKPKEIYEHLQGRFGDKLVEFREVLGDSFAIVRPDALVEVARALRDDPALGMEMLSDQCGSDLATDKPLESVYHLTSIKLGHTFTMKVLLPRDNPRCPSLVPVWDSANWFERESYDLYGIVYEGHPDLRRILLPDDWQGWPMRKDYEMPEWHNEVPLIHKKDIHGDYPGLHP